MPSAPKSTRYISYALVRQPSPHPRREARVGCCSRGVHPSLRRFDLQLAGGQARVLIDQPDQVRPGHLDRRRKTSGNAPRLGDGRDGLGQRWPRELEHQEQERTAPRPEDASAIATHRDTPASRGRPHGTSRLRHGWMPACGHQRDLDGRGSGARWAVDAGERILRVQGFAELAQESRGW